MAEAPISFTIYGPITLSYPPKRMVAVYAFAIPCPTTIYSDAEILPVVAIRSCVESAYFRPPGHPPGATPPSEVTPASQVEAGYVLEYSRPEHDFLVIWSGGLAELRQLATEASLDGGCSQKLIVEPSWPPSEDAARLHEMKEKLRGTVYRSAEYDRAKRDGTDPPHVVEAKARAKQSESP